MLLEDEARMDENVPSSQSSQPIDLAMIPFPTPNMDIASILNPTPRLLRRSCNKPYSLEQIHFMQYCKEDLKLSWPETESRFRERFPNPARDVSMVGLQCRYYRAQRYPMLDIAGNPVLDDDGMIIMHDITVRERGQKGGLKVPILDDERRPIYNENNHILVRELNEEELHGPLGRNLRMLYQKYFKFIDRVPEYAEKYRWIRNEHKAVAKRNTKCNQEHGIELPGAVLPGGVEVQTVLWEIETTRRNSAAEVKLSATIHAIYASIQSEQEVKALVLNLS